MSGFNLAPKPKPSASEIFEKVDEAAARIGFVDGSAAPAAPAPAKPKRGAPVRVTRKNPRRVTVELDGDDFLDLRQMSVDLDEKIQTILEREIVKILRKHKAAKINSHE